MITSGILLIKPDSDCSEVIAKQMVELGYVIPVVRIVKSSAYDNS